VGTDEEVELRAHFSSHADEKQMIVLLPAQGNPVDELKE
jgi:hypothetical protein